MRYLAIDFGRRRLGLAISDPDGRIALPYGVHERQGTRRDVAALLQTLQGLAAEGIVFGLPYRLREDEAESDTARLARDFAGSLEIALRAAGRPLPIAWWDERFSTTEALRQMRAQGISQRQARESGGAGSVDAQAAANILQGFLDSRQKPNEERI
jgi:putative Holliday junction resolvase